MPSDHPSGIARSLPGRGELDVAAWGAQLELALDEQPIVDAGPCANPECAGIVALAAPGPSRLYCSTVCRNRTSRLRALIEQQLEITDEALGVPMERGLPRAQLREHAQRLRAWRARLPAGA